MAPGAHRWLVFAVLGGCATAGPDNGNTNRTDSSIVIIDDDAGIQLDAHVDAAPVGPDAAQMAILRQNTDDTVTVGDSVTCGDTADGNTSENSWYRVFSPAASGITDTFHVQSVNFGVQEAGGTQQVQIKIGTYAGALGGGTIDPAQVTAITSSLVTVPGTSTGEVLTATFSPTADIPAGANVIVEIFTPDHAGTTTYFYVGASAGTEQAPGYIRAPACGVTAPESLKTAAATAGSLILTVSGLY